MGGSEPEGLLILWTSADREVALNMVLMYGLNSRLHDWWPEVTLLIWGPSQTLTVDDEEVRARVVEMREAGVRLAACRACAENLGMVDRLKDLGVEVFYAGQFLADWLHSGRPLLAL
jgi:hypothetical protein